MIFKKGRKIFYIIGWICTCIEWTRNLFQYLERSCCLKNIVFDLIFERVWQLHWSDTWEYFQGKHTYMTSTNIPYWKIVWSSFVATHCENKGFATILPGLSESVEGGVLQLVSTKSLWNHIVDPKSVPIRLPVVMDIPSHHVDLWNHLFFHKLM